MHAFLHCCLDAESMPAALLSEQCLGVIGHSIVMRLGTAGVGSVAILRARHTWLSQG